ncbi:ABC transporter ATP-binding protein [Dethiosulfovibrio salsuginis]|uniref:Sulfonate transport system ATP-binding protein n=1 Tax=Dethiosulfovibrio salsuginis TaxID=561720 RepID=A0A1X7L2M3_9BACT|nr:ATP-binding cassette domain-containing protein [Dethiosulfovibrio salsuginis]SMG47897.1 sulfonate transport system ATP-binding protein [Dethiosulfovibrio salsuginis]
MSCEITSASKGYRLGAKGKVDALKDVTLSFPEGSLSVILGRSGCGKTTLLRVMAGLEKLDSGSVKMGSGKVGMVFQEPRLMPWLSVRENVELVIDDDQRRSQKAMACLHTVGLSDFADGMPNQLSGGMAQRVALARALGFDPDLILLDEPFGALDYFTRKALQEELTSIVRSRKLTTLFVTHDVDEAISIGSRLIVMDGGKVVSVLESLDGRSMSPQDREDLRELILSLIGGKNRDLSVLSKGA